MAPRRSTWSASSIRPPWSPGRQRMPRSRSVRRLEPFDRGLYAGPVGWIDAHGDGEWAIALRCAQFDLTAIRAGATDRIPLVAHAGVGIVAGSDPEAELLETRVKFRPIVDALA